MIVAALKAWSFPLRRGPRGFFAVSTGVDVINERIAQVLGTPIGRRIGWPSFGCDIHRMVFRPNDRFTRKQAEDAVKTAVGTWIPEVTVISVSVGDADDPHVLPISLSYRVNQTGDVKPIDLDVQLLPGS